VGKNSAYTYFLSTTKGLLVAQQAVKKGIGGFVICAARIQRVLIKT
jgi:ribosomal protein S8